MSTNCLFTKLKGVVDNDNLHYYGCIEFKKIKEGYPTGWPYLINLKGTPGIVVNSKNMSTVDIREMGGVVPVPATINSFNPADGIAAIRWSQVGGSILLNKYADNITSISFSEGGFIDFDKAPLEDFKYLTNLTNISLYNTNISGDVSSLSNLTNLVKINLGSTNVSGDISSLSNLTNLTDISIASTNVSGEIDTLGKLTKINSLRISNTKVTGSIEGFVEGQVANGRASVSESNAINVFSILSRVTFGGVKRSSGPQYLTWESSSKIGVYYNSHYGTNYQTAIEYCDTIYTKGYSQAEAEVKWPGKTIIRVDA